MASATRAVVTSVPWRFTELYATSLCGECAGLLLDSSSMTSLCSHARDSSQAPHCH